jgi:hypothetical protein
MTVAELIKELQACSPDATIVQAGNTKLPIEVLTDEWEDVGTGEHKVEIMILPIIDG